MAKMDQEEKNTGTVQSENGLDQVEQKHIADKFWLDGLEIIDIFTQVSWKSYLDSILLLFHMLGTRTYRSYQE